MNKQTIALIGIIQLVLGILVAYQAGFAAGGVFNKNDLIQGNFYAADLEPNSASITTSQSMTFVVNVWPLMGSDSPQGYVSWWVDNGLLPQNTAVSNSYTVSGSAVGPGTHTVYAAIQVIGDNYEQLSCTAALTVTGSGGSTPTPTSGYNTFKVKAVDSGTQQPISGATVNVYTSDMNTLLNTGTTGSDGTASFTMSTSYSTVRASLFATNYQNSPFNVVQTSNPVTTISMTRSSGPTPTPSPTPAPGKYQVSFSVSPPGSGYINLSPFQDPGGYTPGTTVTASYTANGGYLFNGWVVNGVTYHTVTVTFAVNGPVALVLNMEGTNNNTPPPGSTPTPTPSPTPPGQTINPNETPTPAPPIPVQDMAPVIFFMCGVVLVLSGTATTGYAVARKK